MRHCVWLLHTSYILLVSIRLMQNLSMAGCAPGSICCSSLFSSAQALLAACPPLTERFFLCSPIPSWNQNGRVGRDAESHPAQTPAMQKSGFRHPLHPSPNVLSSIIAEAPRSWVAVWVIVSVLVLGILGTICYFLKRR